MSAIPVSARSFPRNRQQWRWLMLGGVLLSISLLIGLRALLPSPDVVFSQLPEPPTFPIAEGIGLGDRHAGGWLLTLWVQAFDSQAAGEMHLKDLDYERLAQWLKQVDQALPHSEYPIKLAVMTYGAVLDPVRQRQMYQLAQSLFEHAPDTRWYWMAMATSMAWHKLGDHALALRMADSLYQHAPTSAPEWARFMKLYLYRSHNEVEMALFMARQALKSGRFRDERERMALLRFIERLQQQRQYRLPGDQHHDIQHP